MSSKKTEQPNTGESKGEILVYQDNDGAMKLEVRLQDETLWLTQQAIAELFATTVPNISMHLRNIFDEGELTAPATVKKFLTVRREGSRDVRREIEYYNLDAIISVGYRVKSAVATRFRIWATERLKEYIVKGFALNDERLKEPGGGRYFEELLARIRDIRSSEKVFWRKVLDIYATSIDYDPNVDTSQHFFAQVQNKMHWAAHGHTAAELIFQRADAGKPDMGITNFPGTRLLKRDVEVAKNYLREEELDILNRMVTAYLEVAELQALNHTPMTMQDWIERLDQFLTMTGRDMLAGAGTISHEEAIEKAHHEYERHRIALLEKPTEVEEHFIEAVVKVKQLEADKKKPRKKTDS